MTQTKLHIKNIKSYIEAYRNTSLAEELQGIKKHLKETKEDIVMEKVYALCYLAFEKVKGIQLYDEQLKGAIFLHKGFVTEIRTGEGKSFVGALFITLNSLYGKTYFVTTNDYLAKRDVEDLKDFFLELGLSATYNHTNANKKVIHQEGIITYTASSDLIFDFLHHEFNEQIVKLERVIIDEIDFVLLDNANMQFSIGEGDNTPFQHERLYRTLAKIISRFKGAEIERKTTKYLSDEQIEEYAIDYIYDRWRETVELTELGLIKIEKLLNVDDIGKHPLLYKVALTVLDAMVLLKKNHDYVVVKDANGQDNIALINRINGRLMGDTKKQFGLQQALEIKEGVPLSGEQNFKNKMSYQVFFLKFNKMVGMSGTVVDAKKEFERSFKKKIKKVSPHLPSKRIDLPDIICRTKREKRAKTIAKAQARCSEGFGVLIIVENEKEALFLEEGFQQANMKTYCFTNFNIEEETEIIKQSGGQGKITITTNLMGRGTDIKPSEKGLFVILNNRFESIRVDRQVIGRAARNGQPGGSQAILSLEDPIFERFHMDKEDKYKKMEQRLFESKKIQKRLSQFSKGEQGKIEDRDFARRYLFLEVDKTIEGIKHYLKDHYKSYTLEDLFNSFWNRKLPKIEQLVMSRTENKLMLLGRYELDHKADPLEYKTRILKDLQSKVQSVPGSKQQEIVRYLIKQDFEKNWTDLHESLEGEKWDVVITNSEEKEVRELFSKESMKQLEAYKDRMEQAILTSILNVKVRKIKKKVS